VIDVSQFPLSCSCAIRYFESFHANMMERQSQQKEPVDIEALCFLHNRCRFTTP